MRAKVLLMLMLGLFAMHAQAASPLWKDLTGPQQAVIAPALKAQSLDFDKLPEVRRARLLAGAQKWLTMSSQQRALATRQLQEWQAMSAEEKRAALEQRERFRKLTAAEQQALLEKHRQFMALPGDVKMQLRNQFNDLQQKGADGLSPPIFTPPVAPMLPSTPMMAPPAMPTLPSTSAVGPLPFPR